MCKVLPCKFYYSQAYKSLYRKWLVHPQGRSLKELDQYDRVEFLTQRKKINKKKLKVQKNKIGIVEKLKDYWKSKNKRLNRENKQNKKEFRNITEGNRKFLITTML